MTVGDICSRPVVTCLVHDTLVDAARQMRSRHVGTLVVVDSRSGADRPVGMLTDHDVVTRLLAVQPDAIDTQRVGDAMTPDPVVARETDTLADALEEMQRAGVRRLPVLDDEGVLVGIVAFDDIIELLSDDLIELVRLVAFKQKRERFAHV